MQSPKKGTQRARAASAAYKLRGTVRPSFSAARRWKILRDMVYYICKEAGQGRPFFPRFAKELEIKKETPQKVFAKSAKYITLILYAGACGRSVPCVRFFSFYKCPKGQEGE